MYVVWYISLIIKKHHTASYVVVAEPSLELT